MSQGPFSVGESLASTKLVSIVQHLRHTLGADPEDDDDDDDAMEPPSPSSHVAQVGLARAMGHVDATVWARVTRSKGQGYLPHPHNTNNMAATTIPTNDNGNVHGDDHDPRPDAPDQSDDLDDLPLPSPITVPQLSSKSPVTVPQFASTRPITVSPLVPANALAAVTGRAGKGQLRVDTSSPRPLANSPGPSTSPVSFALTVTPRPLASAFSPVLPTQGQGLGQAATVPTSFGFETIDSHHHHHHHHHHDQINDTDDHVASADISVIHALSSSAHLFLSLGGGFTASASTSTPFASTDQGPLNRAYCDIEVSACVGGWVLAWVPQTLPHNQPCHFYHIIANLFAYFPSSNRYSIPFSGVGLRASLRRTHTSPHTPSQRARDPVAAAIAADPPRTTVPAQ